MLPSLIQQLQTKQDLSAANVADAVRALIDPAITAESKADFLIALAEKGETVAELAVFVRELRALSIQPTLDPSTRAREILDVCGTGGDQLNTFNISTTVALVCAGAGVTVAKHGNRAITSKSGSADVLEALGIRVDLSAEEAAASLRDHGFAFFFAQKFHPAFKHIGPARKLCAERGRRTIFNFLGPLLNPALPSAQLVGVPRPELCQPLALVLQASGVRRGMVVSGMIPNGNSAPRYLDELSIFGSNTIAEFYQDRGFNTSELDPSEMPISPANLSDLAGGTSVENAAIIERLLAGEEAGPKRDAVLLNSAAALFVAQKVKSMADGWSLAAEVIDSKKAQAKLRELQKPL